MEKIYEEQIGGQKSPRGQLNISIVLSFAVAVFAIISLIAVGFNQISFAADPPAKDLTTFNAYIPSSGVNGVTAMVSDEVSEYFSVPFYQADSSDGVIPLFCLEHNKTFDANTAQEYVRGDLINDTGLAYIFSQSATLGGRGIVPREDYPDQSEYAIVERYATQIAIWVYLRDIHGNDDAYSLAANSYSDTESYDIIRQATYLIRTVEGVDDIGLATDGSQSFFDNYILPVVDYAKTSPPAKTVTINGDSTISKVGDDDFYQTEELSISCTDNSCVSYNVSVSGIDGAFVVDKDYNTVEKGTSLAGDASFYVRIPVQSVSETARTIMIDIDAVVDGVFIGAEYYASSSSSLQHVVAIIGNEDVIPAYKEIPVVGSPDTGMNKAQTIYFIGLIVLLCGVGIIYANAKPVETE